MVGVTDPATRTRWWAKYGPDGTPWALYRWHEGVPAYLDGFGQWREAVDVLRFGHDGDLDADEIDEDEAGRIVDVWGLDADLAGGVAPAS